MPQETSYVPSWASMIVEDIEEAFFSVDAGWRFTYLNHHAARILGRSKEALLGSVLWEAFPTLLGTRFEQPYRQAMADRLPQRLEEFFARHQAWYDVRIFPIPQGLIIYLQDITARKQAEAALQRQAARVRAQAEISRTLAEVTHDYQATLDTAARQLAEIIGDACIIRLIAEDAQWIEFTASYHPDSETAAFVRDMLIGTQHQRVSEGLVGRAVQTGQPVLIPVISSELLKANTHPKHWPYLDRFSVSSVLIAPLRATGRVIGIIAMNRDAPGRPYTNDDLTLLQDLSDRVAIAITNARLLQQVQNELAERTKADQALRSSEERFKTLSAAAYEALFIHENRRIIEVNQQATDMYGYSRDELIGMLFDQLTPPEYMTALYERVEQNSTLTGESVGVRKDGSHFFVESRGRPTEYQGKQVRIAAVRDITELKRAEAALRTSEARFTGIVNSAMDAIISIDESQRIVVFNAAAEQMFRCSAAAVIGQPLDQFLPPATRHGHAQHIREFSQAGISSRAMCSSCTLTALRATGEEFPIEATISQTHAAGQLYTVIIRDITERKRAEQERAFLAAIVASSEDAIIGKNLDGVILSWNMGAELLYGYTGAEAIGRFMALLFPVDRPDEVAAMLDIIRQGKHITHYETQCVRKDLIVVDVSLTISPIKDSAGRLIGTSTIARNVTERKRLEAQLLQAQKMEIVGRLAGGIAHDFNNLLTAIISYADLVAFDLDKASRNYADMREIQKAGHRAAALTRQLLSFSRQQIFASRLLNLNDIVVDMDKLLHRLLGANIEQVSLLDADLDLVLVDPSQMEQVIMNLAINARDAMPNGGRLTIETANVALDEQYYVAGQFEVKTGPYVMLAVSDTGMGMDQAIQDQIFEPFFTTKEAGKGTGLGLSTVYGIVKQSEGAIWVYSELGIGTTFKIYLPGRPTPTAVPAPEAPTTQQHTSVAARHDRTILVVEDDAIIRELIHRVLRQAGYITLDAQNGQQGLDLFTAHPGRVDLILTDIMMPRMTGWELVDQLRQQGAHFKVICMSGYTDQAVMHHRLLQQSDAFLQKPFTPKMLLQQIDDLLRSSVY